MKKMWTVIRQEYINRVRNRGFLIGTVLLPILMAALMFLPAALMTVDVERAARFPVVDSTGVIFADFSSALADTNDAGERLYQFEDFLRTPADMTTLGEYRRENPSAGPVEYLSSQVEAGEIGGFFVIPETFVDGGAPAAFYARNVSDDVRNRRFRQVLDTTARSLRIEGSGLPAEEVEALVKPTRFSTFRVGEGGETSEDSGQTFALAYIFAFIFYLLLVISGITAMRATLEEKTARTAELMISSVRPFHLMGGKILGITGMSLTQIAIWFLSGAILLQQGKSLPGQIASVAELIDSVSPSPAVIVVFFTFFVLGFLFYSGLFVSVGAMVNSETEAQNLQTPVTMPIIIAFMMMFLGIRSPDGSLTTILSMVPFFSPILMTVRACVIMPPLWQILLSAGILVAGAWVSIWIAARIFRVGLLMYGKKPNLPELIKWIRYS
ncbi:MAG: ABC transporter permease [Candidatus Eisenbacteria bacterium]|uniref:ABC transporter permease n=1 Tax=Eiseniibacteriota bacterium TaxID=2212470 RepID=A0A956NET3_UNCEI|nr:ABC transporter permease [Candidatus Eisenbacteria bacterium]MCB9463772.1 ABC transporter permease [Candidatus Eisenbacteria bacterium]